MHRRCSINKQQSPGCNTRLPCALLLHHHLPAQVHFPTYLALPSLPRGLLSHPMVSPLFSPTYLPYPLARPVSASEAQEEDGMDLGQRKVCPWGMGERSFWCVCECVCERERGRECVCVRVSLSLSLSLSVSFSLSLSRSPAAIAHSLTMHRLAHTRPHPHPTSLQHSCNVQACRAS
jgi:hypothetical protein